MYGIPSTPWRHELGAVIEPDLAVTTVVDLHIRLAVTIGIVKPASDGNVGGFSAKQCRADIVNGFRCVPPRKLDDHRPPVQIQKDKVAQMRCAIVVADHRVRLVGTRVAVVGIVAPVDPPGAEGTERYPADNHQQHSESQEYRPMEPPFRLAGGHHDIVAVALAHHWSAEGIDPLDSRTLGDERITLGVALLGVHRARLLVAAGPTPPCPGFVVTVAPRQFGAWWGW